MASEADNLPDPRFRKPLGLHELQNIVNLLLAKNGFHTRFIVMENPDSFSPVARFRGTPQQFTILVNPRAAREIPPNTWAFILGHEIAHGVDARARTNSGATTRQIEWTADELGAAYAIRGGFDLNAHAGWVFNRPNRGSETYGSEHERATRLVDRYGGRWPEIHTWQQRYRSPLR